MSKQLVGLVGWRGMVGSVLMDRMQAEGDFDLIEPVFFSTSNAGGKAPAMARTHTELKDANDVAELAKCVRVCENCHRKIHAGVVALPPDTSRVEIRGL